MKKKDPSNVFTLPKWMIGIKAKEPEGTYTPDQVAHLLEMNLLFNDNSASSLRECVADLVHKVPLKNQKMMKAILTIKDDQLLLERIGEFIAKVAVILAQFPKEEEHGKEKPVTGTSGDSIEVGWDSGMDDSSVRRKPSTRGLRALRAAKRQSSET